MAELIPSNEFDFDIPDLYDDAIAEQGLWHDADEPRLRIEFLCRHFAENNPETMKQRDMILKRRARELKVRDVSPEEAIRTLVTRYIILDWRSTDGEGPVKDRAGNPVPFSEEAAEKFFSDPKRMKIAVRLLSFAMNDENYMGEESDAAGN